MAGLVRVTSAETVADHILAKGLATLYLRHPEIMVELIPDPRELSLSMREADISVRLKQPDQHDLVVRCIGTIAFGLYASPDYLERNGRPDFQAGCSGHYLVTQLEDIQDATQTGWLTDLAPRARVSMQTSSHEAAVSAAVQGGGAGVFGSLSRGSGRWPDPVGYSTPCSNGADLVGGTSGQSPNAQNQGGPDAHYRVGAPTRGHAVPSRRRERRQEPLRQLRAEADRWTVV